MSLGRLHRSTFLNVADCESTTLHGGIELSLHSANSDDKLSNPLSGMSTDSYYEGLMVQFGACALQWSNFPPQFWYIVLRMRKSMNGSELSLFLAFSNRLVRLHPKESLTAVDNARNSKDLQSGCSHQIRRRLRGESFDRPRSRAR